MSFKKLMGAGALAIGGTGALALATSGMAFADGIGWDPQFMIDSTGTSGVSVSDVDQSTFASIVQQITTFLFGMAIVAVVLRIVLTALDRLVFGRNDQAGGPGGRPGGPRGGNMADEGTVLSKIPLIGAYAPSVPWTEILKNVIKNVAIVAGAWVLVNFLVGIVQFIFTALIQS